MRRKSIKVCLKKYWPDVLIIIGIAIYVCCENRYPMSEWQIVNDQIVGNLQGYTYDWSKIVPIMIIVIGLDVLIRRWYKKGIKVTLIKKK